MELMEFKLPEEIKGKYFKKVPVESLPLYAIMTSIAPEHTLEKAKAQAAAAASMLAEYRERLEKLQ